MCIHATDIYRGDRLHQSLLFDLVTWTWLFLMIALALNQQSWSVWSCHDYKSSAGHYFNRLALTTLYIFWHRIHMLSLSFFLFVILVTPKSWNEMMKLGDGVMPDNVLLTQIKLFVDGHERQQTLVIGAQQLRNILPSVLVEALEWKNDVSQNWWIDETRRKRLK